MIPQEEMSALDMNRLDLYSIITFLKGLLREENEARYASGVSMSRQCCRLSSLPPS